MVNWIQQRRSIKMCSQNVHEYLDQSILLLPRHCKVWHTLYTVKLRGIMNKQKNCTARHGSSAKKCWEESIQRLPRLFMAWQKFTFGNGKSSRKLNLSCNEQ